MLYENMGVTAEGHFTFGGADTTELAAEYGTPLYVMDENMVRKAVRRFMDSMEKYYGGRGEVHYASKAFSCMEMCRIINSEGDRKSVV